MTTLWRETLVSLRTIYVSGAAILCTALGMLSSWTGHRTTGIAFILATIPLLAGTVGSGWQDIKDERDRQAAERRNIEPIVGDLMNMAMGEAAFVMEPETSVDARGIRHQHHPAAWCDGQGCPIHHPSDHHMNTWPIVIRGDRPPLVERWCEHGVGHPDPDSLDYIAATDPDDQGAWGVHGCDGCCRVPVALPAPVVEDDDTNGRGARLEAVQHALADAVKAAEPGTAASMSDAEVDALDCCIHCDMPIVEDDEGLTHVLPHPKPRRRACPPSLVGNRTITVATAP